MLTKSDYLLGLQCPKLLWNKKHNFINFPKPNDVEKAKFKEGDLIGEFAKKLFPEGVDLSKLDFKENITKTKELLEKRVPLFEVGFLTNDLFSRADILVPTGKLKWDIVEVKSATKVKDVNIHDVSFQKYIYEKAGLKIRSCFILHVNNQYVKDETLDLNDFFVKTDVTEKVKEFILGIEKRIDNMLKIINSKEEPKISIGIHCLDPYECALKKECWRNIPDGSVFEFYGMLKRKSFELYNSGIIKLKEVPDSIKLNDKQKIQKLVAEKNELHKEKTKIQYFLDNLKYPIYYLDFETINPAIPKFDGMKPYQRIPFQFSLHIQEKPNGKLKHISFLADGIDDPRPKFLQALKNNLGDKGDILVYNQSFEKGVLKECVDAFPEFENWLENINLRIKDLWDVFKNFWYYDKNQKGSASIKYVLPILSDLKYDDLDIKKGNVASYEWERITYLENVTDEEKQRVREALEKYCELDTLAEVEIVNGLRKTLQ
jgi:hypothetical protein